MRCYWYDCDRLAWQYYESHFDVTSSGEAGMIAGAEIGRASVGSVKVWLESLYIIPDSVPRAGWPDMPEAPSDRPE